MASLPLPTLAYDVFDPSSCAFPSPRVPLLPTLGATAGTAPAAADAFEIVGEDRPRRTYTRGRYALFDAYRLTGVGPAGSLLAPAYHCRTMLDPAIQLGAPILLYPLDEGLSPDMGRLEQLVREAPRPVRAMLLSHYFGIVQAAAPIKAFCDAHGIDLIEDCSHALFGRADRPGPGRTGRYVTASPYKMFPCEEGGLLIAAEGSALPGVRRAGLRAELKTIANGLERRWMHVRARPGRADIDRLDDDIAAILRAPLARGMQARANLPGTSQMYVPQEQGLAATRTSAWLAARCDVARLAAQRRANYSAWSAATRALPHCRPAFDPLPDDCVPYMFPLLIEHPRVHFFVLKKLGVPIWRWDDMAASACGVSQHYREHLLHLPCHQALSDVELEWMTTAVAKVMRISPSAGR